MKLKIVIFLFIILLPELMTAQDSNVWSLSECIAYALTHNIPVRQSELSNQANSVSIEQVKSTRFPTVDATARQNFTWSDVAEEETYKFTGSNSSSVSVNASVALYNGSKTSYSIKQAMLDYEAGKFDLEQTRETISLNVMDAFL